MSIIDLTYAKTLLGISDSTYDTEIQDILDATTVLFEKEAMRHIESASVTEYLSGDGGRRIWLKEQAESITSIHVSASQEWDASSLIDAGDYLAEDLCVTRTNGGAWSLGVRNIRVIYNGGFTTIPDDIKWAAMSTLQTKWNILRLGQSGKDILESESHNDWDQKFRQQMSLSQEVKDILFEYRPWQE